MGIKKMAVRHVVEGRPTYFVVESDSVREEGRYMTEHKIGAVPVLPTEGRE